MPILWKRRLGSRWVWTGDLGNRTVQKDGLQVEGAHYNMTEWFIDYGQDLLDDTLINEVSTTTQDDVASDADHRRLQGPIQNPRGV